MPVELAPATIVDDYIVPGRMILTHEDGSIVESPVEPVDIIVTGTPDYRASRFLYSRRGAVESFCVVPELMNNVYDETTGKWDNAPSRPNNWIFSPGEYADILAPYGEEIVQVAKEANPATMQAAVFEAIESYMPEGFTITKKGWVEFDNTEDYDMEYTEALGYFNEAQEAAEESGTAVYALVRSLGYNV